MGAASISSSGREPLAPRFALCLLVFSCSAFVCSLSATPSSAVDGTRSSWIAGIEVTTVITALLIGALLARLAYVLPRQSALTAELDRLRQDTTQKEQLDALSQRLSRLSRVMLERLPSPALWVDHQGTIQALNSSAGTLIGPQNDMVGQSVESTVPIRLVDETGTLDPAETWFGRLLSTPQSSQDQELSAQGVLLNREAGSISLRLTFLSSSQASGSTFQDREGLLLFQRRDSGFTDDCDEQSSALQLEGMRWLTLDLGRELASLFMDIKTTLRADGSDDSGDTARRRPQGSAILPHLESGERAAAQLISFASDSRRAGDSGKDTDSIHPGRTRGLRVEDLLADSAGAGDRMRQRIPESLPSLAVERRRTVFVLRCILATCRRLMQPGDELQIEASLAKAGGDGSEPLPNPVMSRFAPQDISSRDSFRNTRDHVRIIIRGASGHLDKAAISSLFYPTRPGGLARDLGVGFAAAKEIMRRQKGSFAVSSNEKEGTRFTLTLPITSNAVGPRIGRPTAPRPARNDKKQANVSAAEPRAESPSQSSPKAPTRAKRSTGKPTRGRVLVMDDEQSILALLSAALRRLGFEPVTTKNGEEAVSAAETALAEHSPFRLAILDLTIPGGMGGVDTASHLGKMQPDMILIASSGYAQNPALIDFRAFGFDEALVKPYRIPDLSKLLDRLLEED